MKCIIEGIDFYQLEAMKYFSPSTAWSEEKKKENAMQKIFSGDWYGAQKRDGAFYMCGKNLDGEIFLRPRARNVKKEFVNKVDWVPHLHNFLNNLEPGTVLLGELYLPRDEQAKSTSSIMNSLQAKAIKRQEKDEDKLILYVFDMLASSGISLLQEPAFTRFRALDIFANRWNGTEKDRFDDVNSSGTNYNTRFVEFAKYVSGAELWDTLQILLADGYEGMVITYKDAPYQPGKRSNKVSLKIKKELQDTVDCIIIGANSPSILYTGKEVETWPYWFNNLTHQFITADEYLAIYHTNIYVAYNEGMPVEPVTKNYFYGWAGSLKLGLYDGDKLVHVGDLSGIDESIRANWKDYVGAVAEISCMEIHDTGGLRHPRFLGWRTDKNPKDCIMEQIR